MRTLKPQRPHIHSSEELLLHVIPRTEILFVFLLQTNYSKFPFQSEMCFSSGPFSWMFELH